jgi:CRISPR/Cas system-associated exonuclease Cas4 (RecB family)
MFTTILEFTGQNFLIWSEKVFQIIDRNRKLDRINEGDLIYVDHLNVIKSSCLKFLAKFFKIDISIVYARRHQIIEILNEISEIINDTDDIDQDSCHEIILPSAFEFIRY